jgi:hypothetical protein
MERKAMKYEEIGEEFSESQSFKSVNVPEGSVGDSGSDDLVLRLRKRAEIRRGIPRPEPDRISNVLEEAANRIETLQKQIDKFRSGGDINCNWRLVPAEPTQYMAISGASVLSEHIGVKITPQQMREAWFSMLVSVPTSFIPSENA